ncbi:MAG: shikimate dehydrogenase [Rhodoferax sp.]|uniref:shikimate dehydrogenase family protein n=1 Tax=Rhodoferax sp. TaxID=50421 RepID=UPI002628135F|nr:shikimate dehydrogenase [Rhodoferax sp.]MDD2882446.1 shikimate dehydrogenase [Rhodoferax sp.]
MNDQRNSPTAAAAKPSVSGSTDIYLILGDPVEQVLAPETFNPLFARFGHDALLVPVQVAPENLEAFVKTAFLAKNIKGMWITIPHKVPVMNVLDRYSDLARQSGAVNAIRRNADGSLEGGLFDGEGLVDSLNYFNMAFAGKKVLILGAGGAAAAIGASLVQPRPTGQVLEVALFDPTPGKALEVAQRLSISHSARVRAAASNNPEGFDLVINASPLGLNSTDSLPCDVSRMAPHAAVIDIVMKNYPTPLVNATRARGLHAEPGFEMLIQQAHLYMDFFGFTDIATALRHDTTCIREQIYPAKLQEELAQAQANFLQPRAA